MSLYGIRKLCKNTILQSRSLCVGRGWVISWNKSPGMGDIMYHC